MPPKRSEVFADPTSPPPGQLTIGDAEFDAIRRLVKSKTGISLGLHKRDLVVSRLARRLRILGLADFRAYVDLLDSDDGTEMVQMINRITTNKTDFFRERHHFDFLTKTLLPELVAEGEASGRLILRAWSAGCSSGEEPYSIAITLREFFANRPGWDVKLLATDLDTSMLEKASRGEYESAALEPVPGPLINKYFERQGRGEGSKYQVKPELRSLITFRKFNLMHPEYPIKVPLDFVFCRNVLIYFEQEDKLDILRKFHKVIKPGGYIFVGHSESLMMAKDLFRYIATTAYRKL
ncbi:MAG: protein-glutamate O-methyltransferase CheR [Desulfarculus sp.]|nr:protein-glutamate O-methyltransferase CheR [Desulfarculus sp.]